jgi:hypothetical protein
MTFEGVGADLVHDDGILKQPLRLQKDALELALVVKPCWTRVWLYVVQKLFLLL